MDLRTARAPSPRSKGGPTAVACPERSAPLEQPEGGEMAGGWVRRAVFRSGAARPGHPPQRWRGRADTAELSAPCHRQPTPQCRMKKPHPPRRSRAEGQAAATTAAGNIAALDTTPWNNARGGRPRRLNRECGRAEVGQGTASGGWAIDQLISGASVRPQAARRTAVVSAPVRVLRPAPTPFVSRPGATQAPGRLIADPEASRARINRGDDGCCRYRLSEERG